MIEYERRVYHFFDLLGDVGGFFEALYVLSQLAVSGIASKLMFASMIRDIFQVRIDTNKTDIKRLMTKLDRKHSNNPTVVNSDEPWKESGALLTNIIKIR